MARFDTVTNIIADVGTELGLGTLTAAFPATDTTTAQLQALLKSVGRQLMLDNPWLQQKVDYSFATTTATVYNMPSAFESMVDGSGWNRSSRQPLVPLGPQQWEAMKATGVTVALPVYFRPGVEEPATGLRTIELLATPTSGQTIALQYWSRLWVRPTGATPTFLDAPAAITDTLRIEAHLVTRALKLAWLRNKGFESTAAEQDYEAALDGLRQANAVAAGKLTLNGPSSNARLLSDANIPETGYGA